ncbi:hypothetical protein H5410_052013 [Solanum commersonii]|uniref:DUF4283 domain-containing protein n=1 Tax=Solanum commersonii TaxID=4109 RepID=A0A9J5X069_SOLCO|nr:hypothetical protein H5410_052013 [Solanum commersonii]
MHKGWTYPMRTLKWDPLFDPEEETSTTIAWISFPALPPNSFVREAVFSLATAVGKPLQDKKEGGTEKETGGDKRIAEQLKEGPRVGEQQQPKPKVHGGFKEQKNRRGSGWKAQDRRKPEQIWNKKNIQQERVEIVTENKFCVLNNNEETRETREETFPQGVEYRTKQWEEEAGELNSKTRGKKME